MSSSHQIVVISSSVDVQFAAQLGADLSARGLDVLDATRAELEHPERGFAHTLTAGALLIVLSSDGLRSAWLEREISHALDLAATHPALAVIPVTLTPGLATPDRLAHLQRFDFAGRDYEQALAELFARLAPLGDAPSSNGATPATESPPLSESASRSGPLSWQQLEEMKRSRRDALDRQTATLTPPAEAPAPAEADAALRSMFAETEYMLWGKEEDADLDGESAPDDGATTGAAATAEQPAAEPSPAAQKTEVAPIPDPAIAPAPAMDPAPEAAAPAEETLADLVADIPSFPFADEIESRNEAEPETQVTASRFLRAEPAPAVAVPEDVAFTAFHPREVDPKVWQEMLLYIAADTPRSLATVAADAEARLAKRKGGYRDATARSNLPLTRGTLLTIVPDLPGFDFNPASITVAWEEDAQRHEFRLRSAGARPGQAANGTVRIYAGPYLRGEIPISIFVQDPQARVKTPGGMISVFARAYHKIFASYSHKDTEVVQTCEAATEALGDRYLRDVNLLRSGEQWNERLLAAIDEADIFQLFWSEQSAKSFAVEQEWRHALALAVTRPGFIRPVYWTGKPYPIPAELAAIHFDRLDLSRLGARPGRSLVGRLLGR